MQFMNRRSKNANSRKSLKSIAINEDTSRKQVINLNQDEVVHLPNKTFYNSDGSKF